MLLGLRWVEVKTGWGDKMGVEPEGSGGWRLPNFGRRAEVFKSPMLMPPATISTLQ